MDFRKKDFTRTLRDTIFSNVTVPDHQLKKISSLFSEKTYSRNSFLLMEGDRWDRVFYIQSGLVRLFYIDQKGRDFNKGFFFENHLVWPIAPSARREDSLFSIAALEETRVRVCSFNLFFETLSGCGMWEKFALPYAESFAEEKFTREYEFLLKPAAERYRSFCVKYPGLVNRIPDYHLASYIGISNVSLSRIKSSDDFNLC